jgi:hypothetical protein
VRVAEDEALVRPGEDGRARHRRPSSRRGARRAAAGAGTSSRCRRIALRYIIIRIMSTYNDVSLRDQCARDLDRRAGA